MRDHAFADRRNFYFAELEGQRGGDVTLLSRRLADEELTGLAVMVREAFSAQAALGALLDIFERREAALRRFPRTSPKEFGW